MKSALKILVALIIITGEVRAQVIENFEAAGAWMWAPWNIGFAGTIGTKIPAALHAGSFGLSGAVAGQPWYYRTDVVTGVAGNVVSGWARADQRNYLGFGATAGGGWSIVLAPNTNQLIIQQNAGWGYLDLVSAPVVINTGAWYFLQLTYNTTTNVTGRLYDAGMVLVATTPAVSPAGFVNGGVSMRIYCSALGYFDDISLTPAPLPIELLEFTGKENTSVRAIDLNWTTGLEKNNQFFSVERSLDGYNFENIGTVNGAGNSNTIKEYAFTDANPFTGVNYYRLRQVDVDGNYTLSKTNVISVDVKAGNPSVAQVFPTVSSGVFNIQVPADNTDQQINVTDITGKIVHSFNVAAGNNTLSQFDISSLNPGFYMVSCKNNLVNWSKKIFVEK